MPPGEGVTRLLERLNAGDAAASEELIAVLYAELKQLAAGHMRGEAAQTLHPTALVHEALLSLGFLHGKEITERRALFALVSKAMRSVLVDHARARGARKRGGDRLRITLVEEPRGSPPAEEAVDVLDVHGALEELGKIDAELATAVQLRYFGGLSVGETAAALDMPLRTAERRLRVAGTWLRERLHGQA